MLRAMRAASDHDADVSLDAIDLTDRARFRHGFPHAVFTALRRSAPVYWHAAAEHFGETGGEGFWVLSKYADIQAANRDTGLFSAQDGPQLGHRPEIRGLMLVSMDGAEHTRLRKLISAGFTPRMVGRLEQQARRWAASILDEALARSRCDFVADVAYKLPMHMIADIVGIPLEDRAWLFDRVNDFLQCTDPEYPTPAEQQVALQLQMFQYAKQLSASRRQAPQDDVWTRLCTVEVETDDGATARLGEAELDLFFMLLTVAGSETTRNAISHGLLALLENPDQLAVLRADPGAMPGAVEEILRWSSPVSYFARRATRDTRIRDTAIAAGERVTLWYPSGNRDEEVFEDPFRFDIARPQRPHLAFGGGGPHFCLGASLARREIAILFEELLARTGEIEVLGPPAYSVQGIFNPIYVSLQSLPVRLEPR
jgi:cytochrome P450